MRLACTASRVRPCPPLRPALRLTHPSPPGENVDLYIPRKCAWTNRLITAKDHASIQINIGHLDDTGVYTGQYTTLALSGFVRAMVRRHARVLRVRRMRPGMRLPAAMAARRRHQRALEPCLRSQRARHGDRGSRLRSQAARKLPNPRVSVTPRFASLGANADAPSLVLLQGDADSAVDKLWQSKKTAAGQTY